MIKLYKARSLLYRRQILQQNLRWKALDEIYKIYMLLHCSDLNIPEKIVKLLLAFFGNFFQNLPIFEKNKFCLEFDEILSEFRKHFRKC